MKRLSIVSSEAKGQRSFQRHLGEIALETISRDEFREKYSPSRRAARFKKLDLPGI